MKNNLSEEARKRRGIFLLCLPLVLLPLLGIIIWKANPVQSQPETEAKGLNLSLPSPMLEKNQETKADAYLAVKEEDQLNEEWPLPGFLNQSHLEKGSKGFDYQSVKSIPISQKSLYQSSPTGSSSQVGLALDPDEQVRAQLLELEKLLGQELKAVNKNPSADILPKSLTPDPELLQLEEMMEQIELGKKQPDPEIQQLERLMDKILQLQYPDRFPQNSDSSLPNLDQIPVEPVSNLNSGGADSSLLELDPRVESSNGFFGLERERIGNLNPSNNYRKTISSSVAKTQEIIPGEALEIRLGEELQVGELVFEQGTILYAKTKLESSRLQAQVNGIIRDGIVIPIVLNVYGLDGIAGIELSDMKGATQWLQESGRSVESMNIMPIGMDWQSQVANSGIQATRGLLREKSRIKKIEIKAGHPLLLLNFSNTKQTNL
jgi:conjugative transposon TraM protein